MLQRKFFAEITQENDESNDISGFRVAVVYTTSRDFFASWAKKYIYQLGE